MTLSTLALTIGSRTKALADTAWQGAMRRELPEASARLAQLLTAHGLVSTGGCGLFQWVVIREANAIHELLARQGVLTRLFPHPPSLRFGLPGCGSKPSRKPRRPIPMPAILILAE